MKYKVSDLSGALLDAAVARCEGYELDSDGDNRTIRENGGSPSAWHPSTDWACGGPIIEREQISVWRYIDRMVERSDAYAGWWACADGAWGWDSGDVYGEAEKQGPTPLIAAMRAYTASVFGDEVELP